MDLSCWLFPAPRGSLFRFSEIFFLPVLLDTAKSRDKLGVYLPARQPGSFSAVQITGLDVRGRA